MNDQELQDLIRLKRYEQPEEGYYESFLEEFHDRRQKELLTSSARGLLMERVSVWFDQLGAVKWVAGAGLAYATVALGIAIFPGEEKIAAPALSNTGNAVEEVADRPNEGIAIVPLSLAHSEPVSFTKGQRPLVGGTDQLF